MFIENIGDISWIPDTSASTHASNEPSKLSNLLPYTGHNKLLMGDGTPLSITHMGTHHILTPSKTLTLNDVLLVPSLKKNRISVSQLTTDSNCSIEFTPSSCMIKDLVTKTTLAKGICDHGLYSLSPLPQALVATREEKDSLWHQRLGHASPKVLRMISNKSSIHFSIPKSSFVCEGCELEKQTHLPFSILNKRALFPLHTIYYDVWGPSPIASVTSYCYNVIFIDSFSKYAWLYPMHNKSDVFTYFVQSQALVENYFDTKIKLFQCDGGGEYNSTQLIMHLQKCGITRHLSCPHTPEQNGVVKGKTATLLIWALVTLE